MTTSIFKTVALRIPEIGASGGFLGFFETEMTAVYRDDTTFSFETLSETSDGRARVQLDLSGTYDLSLGGLLPYLLIFTSQVHLYQISWQDGGSTQTATLLSFDLDLGDDGVGNPLYWRYMVQVDGTPLPEFESLSDVQNFWSGITEVSMPETESGTLDWSKFTNSFESQDDSIDPLAQLRLQAFGKDLENMIDAGSGNSDKLVLSTDIDGIVVDLSADILTGYEGRDFTILNFEQIVGTYADDNMTGDNLKNSFTGLAGDDLIDGGDGQPDVALYNKDPSGVRVNLKQGFAIDGWGDTDTVVRIERVLGSEFDDVLVGNQGNNTLKGRSGDDTLVGLKGQDLLEGGDGNDQLNGGADNDRLFGDAGDDQLYGGEDKDELYGGAGDDEVHGEAGNDDLFGDEGHDWLVGGDGDDFASGGSGNDLIEGNAGSDTLNGNSGNDLIKGGQGIDFLWGGEGSDKLHGGADRDFLHARHDDDQLFGGRGDDTLVGGRGTHELNGGQGDDVLRNNLGINTLTGGTGADTFHFVGGAAIVTDYDVGLDRLLINADLIADPNVQTALDYAVVQDDDIVFDFGSGRTLIIEGVHDLSALTIDLTF